MYSKIIIINKVVLQKKKKPIEKIEKCAQDCLQNAVVHHRFYTRRFISKNDFKCMFYGVIFIAVLPVRRTETANETVIYTHAHTSPRPGYFRFEYKNLTAENIHIACNRIENNTIIFKQIYIIKILPSTCRLIIIRIIILFFYYESGHTKHNKSSL